MPKCCLAGVEAVQLYLCLLSVFPVLFTSVKLALIYLSVLLMLVVCVNTEHHNIHEVRVDCRTVINPHSLK